jgi:hypothetical protein
MLFFLLIAGILLTIFTNWVNQRRNKILRALTDKQNGKKEKNKEGKTSKEIWKGYYVLYRGRVTNTPNQSPRERE